MLWWAPLACTSRPAPTAEVVSAPCVDCHAEEVRRWEGSHHALAEAPLQPEDEWARKLGGVRRIGVDPLVQALVPGEDGRLQAHQRAWDPSKKEFFEIFEDGREGGEWGHWTGGGMNWNSRCAACHNTGVEKNWQGNGYETTVAEMGVTCAACHGDASDHAAGGAAPRNARMEDTCLSCHTRRAELTGDFVPGDLFLDHFVPTLIDDPVFRADGRGLDEVFASGFLASAMHAGGVRCGDCHDPHSGGLVAEGDGLCRNCHDALGPPAEHAGHDGAVPCVACHMPTTTVMGRHARLDHGFTTPRAGLSPDPCAGCHTDHVASTPAPAWVSAFEAARRGEGWKELPLEETAPTERRAAWISTLGGYRDAGPVLRQALQSPEARIRVAAATVLVPQEREDMAALERAAADPIRAVRVGAQRAIASAGAPAGVDYRAALNHNADDPAMAAERGLVRIKSRDRGGLADLENAVHWDRGNPELVILLATGLTELGRGGEAVDTLRVALLRFPEHAELHAAAGLSLAAMGEKDEAVRALKRAVELDPSNARVWRNLALLHHAAGRWVERDQAVAEALARNPEDAELAAWAKSLR